MVRSRKPGARVLVALVIGAASFAPSLASSAPPPRRSDAATVHDRTEAGDRKLAAEDFAGALVDFETANTLKPSPTLSRLIGVCDDHLGRYAEAVIAYERFLANVPPKLAAEGEGTRKRVADIKAMRGTIHLETEPPGATVLVDGYAESQPSPLDVSLTPGRHLLRVTKDGKGFAERDVDVEYGSVTSLKLDLVAPPTATESPAPPLVAPTPALPPLQPLPAEEVSRAPAFIIGGLAVGAAVAGAAFGVVALNDRSRFNAAPTAAAANTAEQHELICDALFGLAITLTITSVVLFVKAARPAAQTAAPPAPVGSPATSHALAPGVVLQF